MADPRITAAQRAAVEPLGVPSAAIQLAAGVASVNTALTVGTRRVSIFARGAEMRYAVGAGPQTALATSPYINQGERLDFAVTGQPNIAAIRAGAVDGTLEITEFREPD